MLKTKKRLLFLFFLLVVVFAIVLAVKQFSYSEKNIENLIDQYINVRYDSISIGNIEDSYRKQSEFYSKKLTKNEAWVNKNSNIEEAKKYFQQTRFKTTIISNYLNKISENQYRATIYVLYSNEDIINDNFVKYVFDFKISKNIFGKYLFDKIDTITNEITYIRGGELHLHEGDVFLVPTGSSCEDGHEH